MSWAKIRYRDFYDIPRIFITTHNGKVYLFDCPFDDELDDYSDRYRIYQLPGIAEDELEGSWERLPERAVSMVGEIPVSEVEFDKTRRNSIDTRILEKLIEERDHESTLVA
ncbi:MAG TPA: hypothetical protein VKF81_18130 [Blastocatellia bacterium]|nr:hypothetical protein [Blastocatellia bacterium]